MKENSGTQLGLYEAGRGKTSLVTYRMEWREESFRKEANWEVTW